MSIDDATPDEWDKIKRDRWHDNRDYKFKPEDDEMQSQAYMHCQGYC